MCAGFPTAGSSSSCLSQPDNEFETDNSGTPRGPTTCSQVPRKPAGDRRRSVREYVDIPSVSTDSRRNVHEQSHVSEFPKGIELKRVRFAPLDFGNRPTIRPYTYGIIVWMKKTLHIDEHLLRDAKSAAGAKTDTDTVRLGLEALVRHGAYERLRALRGSEPHPRDVRRRRERVRSLKHSAA
jgi:Arc/MetJ family transcription regulator